MNPLKYHILQKEEDCRKYIPSMAKLEDYLNHKSQPNYLMRGILLVIIRLAAVVFEYIPPFILTQMIDSPSKYLLMLTSLYMDYLASHMYQIYLEELLLLINASLSQRLFNQCLQVQSQTTFQGILKEIRQVEKATRSFYTLLSIAFQLPFVYWMLQNEVIYDSLKYGVLISLLALGAASVAQVYAWRIQHFSDRRLRLTQDMLSGIKSIKYLQWEQLFLKLIDKERQQEFRGNEGIQYVDTFVNFFRRMTQIVLLFVAFYKMKDIDHAQFYTILVFFDKLVHPLNTFPWCFGEFLGSFLSFIRLWDYFAAKNAQVVFRNRVLTLVESADTRLFDKVINRLRGDHSHKQPFKFELTCNFDEFPQSKLTCIIGAVGSGKSILLEHFCNGSYVGQNPWLFSGSVRDNILFGNVYDSEQYRKCILAAAVDFDDEKQVGFNGTNLSGGQRSRVAICRALYSKHTHYYFDDIFSSVDENVADHIFKSIQSMLNGCTVVIVLNQLQYIQYADYMVRIADNVATLEPLQNLAIKDIVFTHGTKPIQSVEAIATEQPEIDLETEQHLLTNYMFYIRALGVPTLLVFIVTTLLQQSAKGLFELSIHNNIREQHLDHGELLNMFIGLAILTLLRGFAYSYASLVSARKIFQLLMSRVMYLPVKYFDTFSSTFFIRRLFNDLSDIDDLPLNYFFTVVLDGVALITIVASIQLEVLPYCAIAGCLLVRNQRIYRSNKHTRQEQINKLFQVQDFNSFIIETEKGSKVIKNFKQQDHIKRRFNKILLYTYTKYLSTEQIDNSLHIRNFIVESTALLCLVLSGSQLSYTYAYLLFGNQLLSKSINSWRRIINVSQAIQRILQVVNLNIEECKPAIATSSDVIAFKDVWLSYGLAKGQASTQYALSGITFSIKVGQKVAFCGRTGSGKSSLFNLLVRLYEYQKGDIVFLGNSINDYGVQQLRSKLSVVPQQGLIMKLSIRQNIDPEGNNKRIQELLDELDVNLDLDKLCDNLSVGERQIINFIQSMLQDRDIILIDEATSNMDPDTNDKVMKTLFKLSKNKTLLLISHRLENLQHFDMIHVVSEGVIVESGNYEQLTNGTTKFNELRSKL